MKAKHFLKFLFLNILGYCQLLYFSLKTSDIISREAGHKLFKFSVFHVFYRKIKIQVKLFLRLKLNKKNK